MYDYFKGSITDKRKTSKGLFITTEVSGLGYLLEVTERDFMALQINENNAQKIYVLMTHREDAMSLYGFSNKETRDIFQILLSVSGVGAKMAIALLNEFDACNLISLVIDGETELPKASTSLPKSTAMDDTLSILLSLGYEEKEIEDTIAKIMPTIEDSNNSEEVIRKALTCLSM